MLPYRRLLSNGTILRIVRYITQVSSDHSIYRSIAIPSSIDIDRSQVSRYFDISSIEPTLAIVYGQATILPPSFLYYHFTYYYYLIISFLLGYLGLVYYSLQPFLSTFYLLLLLFFPSFFYSPILPAPFFLLTNLPTPSVGA